MVSAWMLYSMLVGILTAGAAWALETLLRNHRLPTRWVWAGGMGLGALWPVWTALRPEATVPSAAPSGAIPLVTLEPLTLQVGSTSFWQLLDTPLVMVWVLATAGLLAFASRLLIRTHRLRKRWIDEEARGRAILISEDWGPGVVGLVNPQIVLPRWCQGIEEGELDLILDHEAEHLKAGDLRLMISAGLAPVLLPWSLPLWWMWHRLQLAVEGDCDLRVLRKNPRATRAYLELLLEVGRRLPTGRMAAAMLSEPERSLERRIRIMTMPIPKKPLLRGALLLCVGSVLVAVACWAPSPMALADDTELPPVVAAPQEVPMSAAAEALAGEPTFTPFTVRPDIKNRSDIARAMEEAYPPLLRDAGIGGTVNVWFFLDETGVIRNTFITDGSSGHPALDDAALSVARIIEFTPALNRDKAVPVWISLPITFSTQSRRTEAPSRSATPTRVRGEGSRAVANPPGPEGAEATPYTDPPVLLNRTEVAAALEAEYPSQLRDEGLGGTAKVMLFIDATGQVQRLMVSETSGYGELDDAALRVASIFKFRAAENHGDPVDVWITLPITFTVR